MKETTMTTKQYNTKDFAKASFARHPLGYVAARHEGRTIAPWSSDFDWLSDEHMADRGWVPVREAGENDLTMPQLPQNAEIIVTPGGKVMRLHLDGTEFPWHVAADSVYIDLNRGMSTITLQILVNTDSLTIRQEGQS